jgi:OOP family OmpA-OmpF porin
MTRRLIVAIFTMTLWAAFVPISRAAQLGPYVGGSYGTTDRDFGVAPFDDFFLNVFFPDVGLTPTPGGHTSSLDTSDNGFAGLVGYRITAHFAVEGMFLDLGEMTYRATTEGTLSEEPFTAETKIVGEMSGIGLHGLAILPLSYRWELYVRGGVQFTTPRLDGRINNLIIDFGRDSSTDFVGGAGIAMSMLEIYGLRLEYMRVFDAGDQRTAEGDTDLLSLGFIVAF